MLESSAEFFHVAGPLPPSLKDLRRFPRFYFRSVAEATIYPLRKDRAPTHCFVLTRDLSRGGVGLLHNEQLFPGQQLALTLNGEPPRAAIVQWCKCEAIGVYSVGCQFAK